MTSRGQPEYSIERGPFRFEALAEEMRKTISESEGSDASEGLTTKSPLEIADTFIFGMLIGYLRYYEIDLSQIPSILRGAGELLEAPEEITEAMLSRVDSLESSMTANWPSR